MEFTTKQKLSYLEKLLKLKGCPTQEITPFAVQILNHCKINKKSILDIELI